MADPETMPQSILVYSVAEISGDGLIKLPFLAGIREAFPGAHLTWCAASGNSVYSGWLAPIARPLMDELLLAGPDGKSLRELLPGARPFDGRRYDLIIDTQQNVRRTLAVKPAARTLITPSLNFALSDRKPNSWPSGLADRLQTLLCLAAQKNMAFRPVKLVDRELVEVSQRLLPDGPAYIGLAPGAGGAERRWPLARFIVLAERMRQRGRMPVFILGPAETDYIPAVRQACPWALMPLQTEHGLASIKAPLLTIALASRMAVSVASDAGPGHMLAAGGSPLVSLAIERRKAEKFRPATRYLITLVGEEHGPAMIDSIPLDLVDESLEALMSTSV